MTEHVYELAISGMHCSSCVAGIEHALRYVRGVRKVSVSFVDATAVVYGEVDPQVLIEAVESQGYEATVIEGEDEFETRQALEASLFRLQVTRFAVAGGAAILLILCMKLNLLPEFTAPGAFFIWGAVVLLTLAIMAFAGSNFFIGTFHSLKRFRANMDTLISLGTGTAWFYSAFVVLFPHFIPSLARHAYFDSALIILALINLGQAFEHRAKGRSSAAIQRLLNLQPQTARLLKGNEETDVPLSEVQMGDILRVKPGDQIPIDGVIRKGSSYIDKSMLTGEPLPVPAGEGDEVIGGTLNKNGTFDFEVTRVGRKTALSRIVMAVKRAQSTKPPLGQLADQIASYFVPAVLVIALVAGFVWFFVGPAPVVAHTLVVVMSVLLIACPCALGLATPISVMLGIGKAAEFGVMIRNGEALQRASKITTVVFDKTGTLTAGVPEMSEVISAGGWDEKQALSFAASAEQGSEHPLADAIVKAAKLQNLTLLPVESFTAEPGQGIQAVVSERQVLLGNTRFMEHHDITYKPLMADFNRLAAQGKTPVYLAVDGQLSAVLAVADPIKQDAKAVVQRLHDMGKRVVMLTGDHKRSAKAVAIDLLIDEVVAEVLPEHKAETVEILQARGDVVAMVGDGINDAAALAKADVGFAIGAGTDIAIESADVVLMSESLISVIDAIELSSATVINIKQNLFGAFFYNALAIPLAAGVFYPFTGWLLSPVVAAGAMALSSLTVVLNALRLSVPKNRPRPL